VLNTLERRDLESDNLLLPDTEPAAKQREKLDLTLPIYFASDFAKARALAIRNAN
jgi:hypothetical protein